MSTDKELMFQILVELIKKGGFKSHLETLQALKASKSPIFRIGIEMLLTASKNRFLGLTGLLIKPSLLR